MADKTAIEWADATLSMVTGCTKVSPGPSRGGLTKGNYWGKSQQLVPSR